MLYGGLWAHRRSAMPRAELVVNVEPAETRVALIEDGVVAELHVERAGSLGIVGSVFHGKVGRVLRGIQAAFIDIGIERHAFLQVGDAVREQDIEGLGVDEGLQAEPVAGGLRVSRSTPIAEVLKPGQSVVVQVSRAPMGRKGARVTSHVSLPGRRLVYMPTLEQLGISRRISDEAERARLRGIVEGLRNGGGFIVRTVAEGASEAELAEDVEYLTRLWADILERRAEVRPPGLLHADLDLPLRMARDLFGAGVERFVVDDQATYDRVAEFSRRFIPDRADRVRLYDGQEPLFDAFGIEEGVKRALARVIPLPSGGSLVIDHAEALTAIDVNTGRYAGGKDLEDTITRTNLEAVAEVAHQLRLRNIGGLIVVDFIDMDRPENREKVNLALQEALGDDRAQTTAVRISELGLVEMTRKGTRQSLGRQLFEPCFYCDGTGQLKSRTTVCCEIVRELRRRALEPGAGRVVVEAYPKVAEMLRRDHGSSLRALERSLGREIEVRARSEFHLERFEIKGGRNGSGETA